MTNDGEKNGAHNSMLGKSMHQILTNVSSRIFHFLNQNPDSSNKKCILNAKLDGAKSKDERKKQVMEIVSQFWSVQVAEESKHSSKGEKQEKTMPNPMKMNLMAYSEKTY